MKRNKILVSVFLLILTAIFFIVDPIKASDDSLRNWGVPAGSNIFYGASTCGFNAGDIVKIHFKNKKNTFNHPSYSSSWGTYSGDLKKCTIDLSKEGETEKVLAYIIRPDGASETENELYIESDGNLLLNENSGNLFRYFTNLTTIDGLNDVDFSSVKNASSMFEGLTHLTTLSTIIGGDNNFGFYGDSYTNTSNMFKGVSSLTGLTFSYFETGNVTNMSGMFEGMSGLTSLTLNSFDTSKVTDMSNMFKGVSSLSSLNVSTFDTSKVTNMSGMFEGMSSLTLLDLANFKTPLVENMSTMFKDDVLLEKVYVSSNWSTASVTASDNMFYNCQKIKGAAGLIYNGDKITHTYARVDTNGTPGYFYSKDAYISKVNILSHRAISLDALKTVQLSYKILPNYFMGSELDTNPFWKVETGSDYITVSETGLVTSTKPIYRAMDNTAKCVSTTVSMTLNGEGGTLSDQVPIKVCDVEATNITIDNTKFQDLKVGDEVTLSSAGSYQPSDATDTAWLVKNLVPENTGETVARIENGKLKCLAPGTGTVVFYSLINNTTIKDSVNITIVEVPTTHTVTFNKDNTEENIEQVVEPNGKATRPSANPTKTGYTFDNWYLNDEVYDFNSVVTANITLVAKYTINKYDVTINTDNGIDPTVQKVDYNTSATKPSNPTKTGHTFDNWYVANTNTIYAFTEKVTGNITIIAKYNINNYTVTLDPNNGSATSSQTISYNNKATRPSTNPSKTGHSFVNWYVGDTDTVYNFNTPVTDNITLKAKYVKNTYNVTFMNGTSGSGTSVEYGETVTPPTPTKTGYSLEGWYNGSTKFNFSTPITSNLTLTANWVINKYTITFNLNGGSGTIPNQTIEYNKTATKPSNPTPPSGKVFVGWYKNDGSEYSFSTKVTDDLVLQATYKTEVEIPTSSETSITSSITNDVNTTKTSSGVIKNEYSFNRSAFTSGDITSEIVKKEATSSETTSAINLATTLINKIKKDTGATKVEASKVYDIDVEVKRDGVKLGTVTKLGTAINISIALDENTKKAPSGYTRTFKVIRIHEGAAKEITGVTYSNGVLTFKNDLFSKFIVTYVDKSTSSSGGGVESGDNKDKDTEIDNGEDGIKVTRYFTNLTVTWDRVTGYGYKVYRKVGSTGNYVLVKTINSSKTLKYKDTNVVKNKTYYYKVVPFGKTKDKKALKVVNGKIKIPYRVGEIESESTKDTITLTWEPLTNVYGYQVYVSTSKNGTYKLAQTIIGKDFAMFMDTNLSSKKTYYYKVRSFKQSGGKKYTGNFSSVIKAKTL